MSILARHYSRRRFLHDSSLLASAFLLPSGFLLAQKKSTKPHAEVCKQKFAFAAELGLPDKTMSEIMATMGWTFLNEPYKAHTLEAPGKERLIVNLKEFDCVTFVETTLALARCIKLKKMSFDEFKRQVQLIRYRTGKIDGYPSRLHYFTDWIDDNEKKGIVQNVTRELGGVEFEKTYNFMSTHRESYKQLSNTRVFEAIKRQEEDLTCRNHFYLQKEHIQSAREQILDGDIIGITTTIDGLDITHTGMAYRFQGYLRFLHAPLSVGNIQITKRTIVDYLAIQEKSTGIMVARPLDPTTQPS
jgi:hypothetical protein